ncbi:hypothetical protein WJX72_012075 [[Myrmecia] bisecta]|uniref:Guanylate cyclase domain-containing protein n=1 Tax=[Myrmecia] bisecta TaxID=41462 RepID=A0AAW1Q5G4_9CHLO
MAENTASTSRTAVESFSGQIESSQALLPDDNASEGSQLAQRPSWYSSPPHLVINTEDTPPSPGNPAVKGNQILPEPAEFGQATPLSPVPSFGKPKRYRPSVAAIKKATQPKPPKAPSAPLLAPSGNASRGRTSFSLNRQPSTTGSIFDSLDQESTRNWRKHVVAILDGIHVSIAVVILTVIVLFMDDFRLAAFPPTMDRWCGYTAIMIFIVFSVELTVASIARPRFFLHFYFLIDLVATLSILLDIPHIAQAINGNTIPEGLNSSALARGTTNSVGTRVRQITRVTRILRLMRLVSLWQQFQLNQEARAMEMRAGLAPSKDRASRNAQRSRVGQKLSDLTTRRVIIGVLGLLLVIPAFNINSGLYGDYPDLGGGGLSMLHSMYLAEGESGAFTAAKDVYIKGTVYNLWKMTGDVLKLSVANHTFLDLDDSSWRPTELEIIWTGTPACAARAWADCYVSSALFDVRWNSQMAAALNLLRTLMIVIVLGLGAVLFNRDATRLVLRPIERMLKKVKDVSENPLAKTTAAAAADGTSEPQMETRILENSINKICSLLAIGFGDAGAEVIADNMKSGGDLNPMVPGSKVTAIFGFCDIRNFTDTTEVLQEEVMEYVNSIAKIVHMEVSLHRGSPNKNIGDAFLLVWKLPREFKQADLQSPSQRALNAPKGLPELPGAMDDKQAIAAYDPGMDKLTRARWQVARDLADRALAAFIIIHAALKRSRRLAEYSLREDLNARMPNFQVRMGFGLHAGWAIEGAIGSEYKIDASYLSPNVNMASRLEAATKQFGTTMLLSEDIYRMLSPIVRKRVRQIDCVTVKGSVKPLGIYTYDICLDNVTAPDVSVHHPGQPRKSASPETYSMSAYDNEFAEHPDLINTWGATPAFIEAFGRGFEAYLSGDWAAAKVALEETRTMRKGVGEEVVVDGPSTTLLEFMGRSDFVAPADWEGFRELTEK